MEKESTSPKNLEGDKSPETGRNIQQKFLNYQYSGYSDLEPIIDAIIIYLKIFKMLAEYGGKYGELFGRKVG